MNPRLEALNAYPFERLARLKATTRAPNGLTHIAMSIGEPQHDPPPFVLEALRASSARLGTYPATRGLPELRTACAAWLTRRYRLARGSVDPDTMVLPVNGTREALFAFVQAAVDARSAPQVAMPNPFYQIYEGAALLAGAEPYLLDSVAASGYLPDLDAVPAVAWRRCQLLILCTPGNPTGAVMPLAYLRRVLALAERFGFIVASDECYADIYIDEDAPPPGLLQACHADGRQRFEQCVVFHSLSKRSSVPGLRSGFVAGDPRLLERFHRYRTYHGGAMPIPTQLASVRAWDDDAHAAANRALYREKFAQLLPLLAPHLPVSAPAGAFYLWPEVGGDDEDWVRGLFATANVTVLPGRYLARAGAHGNPGAGRVRISLVPPLAQCLEAAHRILAFLAVR